MEKYFKKKERWKIGGGLSYLQNKCDPYPDLNHITILFQGLNRYSFFHKMNLNLKTELNLFTESDSDIS